MYFSVWIKEKLFNRKMAKQRYKRGFSDSDCWSMTYWFTETFPQMVLNLRDMKNGAPEADFPEYDTLPKDWKSQELSKYKDLCEQGDHEYDENSIFTKWYILLTRIAYCLTEAGENNKIINEYEDDYRRALWGDEDSDDDFFTKYFVKQDIGYILKPNPVDETLQKKYYDREMEIAQYKREMKDEAFDLIKEYFYDLWD